MEFTTGHINRISNEIIPYIFTTMIILNRAEESLKLECHRVRGSAPSKSIMPPRRKGSLEVKQMEHNLVGIENSIYVSKFPKSHNIIVISI